MFVKAAVFASKAHVHQKRKNIDQTPYINHPLEVAAFLSELEGTTDQSLLAAAVLHDTVEDTSVTQRELNMHFGGRVARLVMECSDNKSLPKVERKKAQIEHARVISTDAKKIKMADKLSNMASLVDDAGRPTNWSEEVIRGYVVWGLAVVREMATAAPRIYEKMCTDVFPHFKINPDMPQEELDAELQKYYDMISD